MRVFLISVLSVIVPFGAANCQESEQPPQNNPPKAVPVEGVADVITDKTSMGVNKQFLVRGASLQLNKSVTALCDEMSKGVYELLGEKRPEAGFYPIQVTLYSEGDAKRQNLFKTLVTEIVGAGYKIELVVDIREQIDRTDLEEGVMQAIVMERTLRTNPVLQVGSKLEVPRWVSDGMLGAVRWKGDARNRGMYEVLTRKPELFPVGKLFTTKQQDIHTMGETARALYEASATAMVMSLHRQKGGKESLSKLLGEVAVFEGETEELLRKHFPDMNVGNLGLQKLWNLQLAEMSAPRMIDTETLVRTEEKLREILFFNLIDKDGLERKIAIKDFIALAGLDKNERLRVTMLLRQDLVQLSYRAYPDYQPILAEYGFILTNLAMNEMNGIEARVEKLEKEREVMYESGQRVRDVLDWYQLTQSRDLKGDFTGYKRLLEQMNREENQAKGLVASYVDQIQKLMMRKESK